jgi:hypothetical protein
MEIGLDYRNMLLHIDEVLLGPTSTVVPDNVGLGCGNADYIDASHQLIAIRV